ncbi:hypothetical protein [Alteromonas mediterranea]|uniref:hypothetical protein n=1 Tax=Alteromonas mediterranea TaxID=314275 RepID=UPI0012FBA35C|nr:hypothetical protein [Alteromonas mediterranea]QGX60918.1 hypothetical protein FJN15_03730 [Alteromonas mediterranea]
MTIEGSSSRTQTGFFSESGELGGSHAQFTEICTALYERELIALSHLSTTNISILKRRMGGLPYHVQSVARFMVSQNSPSPLQVDTHNGSWYAKQPAKCPGLNQDSENCINWYRKHMAYGLIVPVLIHSIEGLTIELDSIDMFNASEGKVHLNKHGWFNVARSLLSRANETKEAALNAITLLKPTKAIMSSACSGHVWNYKTRTMPRALSMREMRLSTQINWKNFTLTPKNQ